MKISKLVAGLAIGCLLAGQAMAVILFSDDFEAGTGHTVGNPITDANGWYVQVFNGDMRASVNNTVEPGMTGQFADGVNLIGFSDGVGNRNDAGIAGGMDTNLEYILSFTWGNTGDATHNTEFGFTHTSSMFGTRATLEGAFNLNAGHSRLIARDHGDDGAGWPGDGAVNDYQLVINATSVALFRDGSQVAGAPMNPATMAGHNGIYWWLDASGGRNAGRIDNITLEVIPEPATLGLLALGGLLVLRRRR